MPLGPDKVRLQTVVDRRLAEQIRDLAKQRMRLSESALVATLLEGAVKDNAWIIKVATSKAAMGLAQIIGAVGTDRKDLEQIDRDLQELAQEESAAKGQK